MPGSWGGGPASEGYCPHCQVIHSTPCWQNSCQCLCPIPPPQPEGETTMGMFDKYAKAIVAAIVAGAGAYGTAATDGLVTQAEWAAVGVAFLTALGLVWGVPNAPQGGARFVASPPLTVHQHYPASPEPPA